MRPLATVVSPGSFDPARHFYAAAVGAKAHPVVDRFFRLSSTEIVERYCARHPAVSASALAGWLRYQARFLAWSGVDLFRVETEEGRRRFVLIEVNSCPAGQKSTPSLSGGTRDQGYRDLLERTFLPRARLGGGEGEMGVLYDKNAMEASGYAAVLADLLREPVLLVPLHDAPAALLAQDGGPIRVRTADGREHPLRAALRYVTQRPWRRLPLRTETLLLNPLLACLAGGRNKVAAAIAYEQFNASAATDGLEILTPRTRVVAKEDVAACVAEMGGLAVTKEPYSNSGQGISSITHEDDLRRCLERGHQYDRVVVQELLGHSAWRVHGRAPRLSHLPVVLDGREYVADLRMMISGGEDGFRPVALFARRAPAPLTEALPTTSSWPMLGTNLSMPDGRGGWSTDTSRLLVMDAATFPCLGIGLDDLVEALVQSVLGTVAIDAHACSLAAGTFAPAGLSDDAAFLGEIVSRSGL